MASISDKAQMFWDNPLSAKQDATQLFLLVGFLICSMLLWKLVLKHIFD